MPLSPREFNALPSMDQKVDEIYGSILEGHDEFLWLHQDIKNVRDDLEEHVADQDAHSRAAGILPDLTPRQKTAAGGGIAAAVITIIVYALEVLGG